MVRLPPRDAQTRKADTLAMLAAPEVDVWVATASAEGEAHLVPVSLAWVGERLVIAIPEGSVTTANLTVSGRARLALGPTRDVVMIDAALERTLGVDDDEALGAAYAAQSDWDPRGDSDYVFQVLRPIRLQAWREANEIKGRTLMRDGSWVV